MVCRDVAAYHYMQQAHLHVQAPCYMAWAQISCVAVLAGQVSSGLVKCLAGWHTAHVSCVHATHVSPIPTQHGGMLHLGLR